MYNNMQLIIHTVVVVLTVNIIKYILYCIITTTAVYISGLGQNILLGTLVLYL